MTKLQYHMFQCVRVAVLGSDSSVWAAVSHFVSGLILCCMSVCVTLLCPLQRGPNLSEAAAQPFPPGHKHGCSLCFHNYVKTKTALKGRFWRFCKDKAQIWCTWTWCKITLDCPHPGEDLVWKIFKCLITNAVQSSAYFCVAGPCFRHTHILIHSCTTFQL